MAKYLAQIIVLGTRIISQAFVRAVQQEYQAARIVSHNDPKSSTTQATKINLRTGLTLDEAIQILNVSPELNPEEIKKNYKTLFELNEKSKGGSFYLQSKIVRAKERLDTELTLKKNINMHTTTGSENRAQHTNHRRPD